MSILTVHDLNKIYKGKMSYEALSNINLTIDKGEFVGIMGPSGSGKTTLLNMVSTIDAPTSGEILINGKNPYDLSFHDLALFRRRKLGFIFQSFNLLNTLTVKENIVLPLTLDNIDLKEMNKRVKNISMVLGIEEILNKRIYEISGGQAQRTAIARALIHSPQLILADEPTGNLDSKAAKDVMELLAKLNKEHQATMMLVTHDPVAASYCDRVVFIKDGMLYKELHCEDNRLLFYKKIIDVQSLLGGNQHEFSSIGME
ncbi:ABC transporter ATP-binding protein [Bacillus pseudomycoides]|uniref:Bacitracin ABC transporter ATP-binding protein n=1 Tax=Bacillus pseudomycoides TaxID=64104 RepID=A0A2B5GYQ4_9BACI|nr:ABC transporter ATP-binding protein [Bacillus pseudomycoides]PDY44123.1 bacitracin ABC transporter ATP-binding protein [Bacillus pseudomycoides]PEA83387.1 bacitracin ABC transporter ATP-binding protein [Bacillus pseudomycoides]PED05418.1 bacitracin ABC transporter ATP-binding protein [Bacillus pseudomycoides]PED71759.1 bacitracin ABC transporter ATP-binding protein [Bacillus pseudomycoides]PEI44833.1 bacitracin ABC transporter ATP-binding protein [Bacillus pseudomycoides]